MSDWFSTAMAFQQEILRAQKAQLDATQRLIDMGRQATAAQQAGIDATQSLVDMGRQMTGAQEQAQRVADANARAFRSWAGLWGWK